ncbi:MAG: protein-glutamate methylesterase/protein-glutamine glutaminase [Vibrionaceae bacterium]
MAFKVLIVDDSTFFRRRLTEIISSDPMLTVVGCAVNGEEAVTKAAQLMPDVITMDVEMPVMNGIDAVKAIMRATPTPILMFSSLTHAGAQATLDALDAGAVDFLPKNFEDIASNRQERLEVLLLRLKMLAKKTVMKPSLPNEVALKKNVREEPVSLSLRKLSVNEAASSQVHERVKIQAAYKASGKQYKVLLIGASTGGPAALQTILSQLPVNFPLPILLMQHMPAAFTGEFAQRLNKECKIFVKEAQNNDILTPGIAYLAPGGMQMLLDKQPVDVRIKIVDSDPAIMYKPSLDVTFSSVAAIYGENTLSLVLTGMGSDGREGARLLKQCGGTIWAQDEETCVVYGMPQAVASANLSSESLPLDRIAERIFVELNLS